jgi:hypothetical protein
MDIKTVDDIQQGKLAILSVMDKFEQALSQMPDAKFGDDVAPLVHRFTPGLYIRQISMPKGMVLTSKIHKTEHPFFVLTGDVSVVDPEGVVRITAPYVGITKPGTKRALYMHEDTIWITVHRTDETDLEKIEDQVIAKSFDEILPYNETKELKEDV